MKEVPEAEEGSLFFQHQVHGDLEFSIPRIQISECALWIHHEYIPHPLGPAYGSSKRSEKHVQLVKSMLRLVSNRACCLLRDRVVLIKFISHHKRYLHHSRWR
jgi:hypothetical protein